MTLPFPQIKRIFQLTSLSATVEARLTSIIVVAWATPSCTWSCYCRIPWSGNPIRPPSAPHHPPSLPHPHPPPSANGAVCERSQRCTEARTESWGATPHKERDCYTLSDAVSRRHPHSSRVGGSWHAMRHREAPGLKSYLLCNPVRASKPSTPLEPPLSPTHLRTQVDYRQRVPVFSPRFAHNDRATV